MVETPYENHGFGRKASADEILEKARRDPDFRDRLLADPAHAGERYHLDAAEGVRLRDALLEMKERHGGTGIL